MLERLTRWREDRRLRRLGFNVQTGSEIDVGPPLEAGQRVRVYGGYDYEPTWLEGSPDGYTGTVIEFIPGQNTEPAAVVELDDAIEVGDARGKYFVLEQGWVGVRWGQTSPRIHVELCDFKPESKRWQDRRQGAWVESHATFEALR